jgi:hypothetical protein
MMAALLAVVLEAQPARAISVTSQTVGDRPSVSVELTSESGPVSVDRQGDVVVVSVAGSPSSTLDSPVPLPPIEGIRVQHAGGEVRVSVTVSPSAAYEVRRDGTRLALLFDAPAAMAAVPALANAPPATPTAPIASPAPAPPIASQITVPAAAVVDPAPSEEVESMQPPLDSKERLDAYRSLFPPSPGNEGEFSADDASSESGELPGFGFGPLRFQPAIVFTYVDGTSSIEGPAPVQDSYLQIEPRLGSQLILWDGRLRAKYEPRLRMRSRFAQINQPSHEVDAALELPVGQRLILRAKEHYAITTLEATEADPGREYYFNLGRFTRNDLSGSAQFEAGPRLMTHASVGVNHVDFTEESGFFSYEQRRAGAAFEFLVTDIMRFRIGYDHEKTPPADERPVIESTANTLGVRLAGELLPLLDVELGAGYMRKRAPRAASGGESFDGLTFGARISKGFARGARLSLDAGRSTYVSSFEDNAFYLSNAINTTFDMRLPLGFTGRAAGGFRRNDYRTLAESLGAPRRDDIFGWTFGLARQVTRWSYLRADFTRERRDSNLDGLDSTSRTLLLQLGISPFTGGAQ